MLPAYGGGKSWAGNVHSWPPSYFWTTVVIHNCQGHHVHLHHPSAFNGCWKCRFVSSLAVSFLYRPFIQTSLCMLHLLAILGASAVHTKSTPTSKAAYRVGVICNTVKCRCSNIGGLGEQKWASSPMSQIYLSVVGDWHGDAVLTGDVVGAVIRGAWARARSAATCRVCATQIKQGLRNYKDSFENKTVWTRRDCGSQTCHIKGAFLGGGDGAVSATQQRTAPPLAHLLLQPGAKLQVGFRGWTEVRRKLLNATSLIICSPLVIHKQTNKSIYFGTHNISNLLVLLKFVYLSLFLTPLKTYI